MSLLNLLKDKEKFFKKVPFYPFIMQYPTPDDWSNDFNINKFIEDLVSIDISKLNIYIHIPFCDYLCKYCSFSKILYSEKYKTFFLESLEKEISFYNKIYDFSTIDIKTIFIGGGTPSVLDIDDIKKLKEIFVKYNIKTDGEFTIETNPDRIEIEKFKVWKKLGVNRISIGVQTFNNDILKKYNRGLLEYEKFISNIEKLRNIGYDNINFDMIYGFKEQIKEDIIDDIKEIKKINPEHISYYPLILYDFLIKDKTKIPSFFEDLEKYYELIKTNLKDHYEFYTLEYANNKKGFKHDYQVNYLNGENVLGLGPSGFSYIGNLWFKNRFSLMDYIKFNNFPIEYVYKVSDEKVLYQKKFIMGIRLNKIDKKVVDYLSKYYNMKEFYDFTILDNGCYYIKEKYIKYQDLLQYYFYNLFRGWKQ